MPELKITSFNCHAGLQARRNGVCKPYDLGAVLRAFDADVIVVQESWTPDGGTAAVRDFGDAVGAQVFELPFGRAPLEPGPRVPGAGAGVAAGGRPLVSRTPAEVRGRLAVGTVPGDPTPERGG